MDAISRMAHHVLGVIPARGGSKRCPKKNIRLFAGKPLLAWAVEAALASGVLDRVVVSTDDDAIAEIAVRAGALVPFRRPSVLAGDAVGVEPVIAHAVEWFAGHEGYTPDAVTLLLPTNPLREGRHIAEALALLTTSGADSVISVSELPVHHHPGWVLLRGSDGVVRLGTGHELAAITTRSQDLPPAYIRNDVVYVLRPANIFANPSTLYGNRVELYRMEARFDVDINTEEDWETTLRQFLRHRDAAFRASVTG